MLLSRSLLGIFLLSRLCTLCLCGGVHVAVVARVVVDVVAVSNIVEDAGSVWVHGVLIFVIKGREVSVSVRMVMTVAMVIAAIEVVLFFHLFFLSLLSILLGCRLCGNRSLHCGRSGSRGALLLRLWGLWFL